MMPGDYCCEVVDVSVQLKSPFTLGQVEGGSITLRGHMANAQWQPGSEREYENFIVSGDKGIEGVWYSDETEGLDDYDSEKAQFVCFAVHSAVTTSGLRFTTGLTLIKAQVESSEYGRMGFFTLTLHKGVVYFLEKE
jgi:hypothetical protein